MLVSLRQGWASGDAARCLTGRTPVVRPAAYPAHLLPAPSRCPGMVCSGRDVSFGSPVVQVRHPTVVFPMPRLLGVDIPSEKKTFYSLQYLYGVGPQVARELCHKAGVDPEGIAKNLHEDELARLASLMDKDYVVEGQLRRQVAQNISRLKDIGSYRGVRHRRGLPVRGQRTRTNARTRTGPKKTVAGKKGVKDLK